MPDTPGIVPTVVPKKCSFIGRTEDYYRSVMYHIAGRWDASHRRDESLSGYARLTTDRSPTTSSTKPTTLGACRRYLPRGSSTTGRGPHHPGLENAEPGLVPLPSKGQPPFCWLASHPLTPSRRALGLALFPLTDVALHPQDEPQEHSEATHQGE
jgi:hypothetical protein